MGSPASAAEWNLVNKAIECRPHPAAIVLPTSDEFLDPTTPNQQLPVAIRSLILGEPEDGMMNASLDTSLIELRNCHAYFAYNGWRCRRLIRALFGHCGWAILGIAVRGTQ